VDQHRVLGVGSAPQPGSRGRSTANVSTKRQPTDRRHRQPPATGPALLALAALFSVGVLAFGAQSIAAEKFAYLARKSSRCMPKHLNRSAVLPGTSVAVSPLPGSYVASAHTQISFLGAPADTLSAISVSGLRSGSHAGQLRAYSQGDGASFVPERPFVPGETVTVRGRVQTSAGHTTPFSYWFVVAHQDVLPPPSPASPHQSAATEAQAYSDEEHFHSAPSLRPPVLTVTASTPQTAPGYLFASPYSGPGQRGPEIFSQSGELVWFHPLSVHTNATNLQVQQLDGEPVLTWWQGYIPPQGFGEGEEIIDNSSYQRIGRVRAGNGQKADLHDFHLTPQGTALLTVFDPIDCDLSSLNGPTAGAVTDSGFQEIDLKTGLVRREWMALNYVQLSDSHSEASKSSKEWPFDYFHINSIDQLPSDVTLIGARNTWGLYRLNTTTGQVQLRVGGKSSEVKQGEGASTAYQHDAMVQPDGTITVFDNGGVPMVHSQSRAITVSIDAQAKTEKLVHNYEHSPALSAGSQGSVQALAGGDTFVGWGAEPYFSEYGAEGRLLYDAHWPSHYESYRGYRFQWTGTPTTVPAIAIVRGTGAGSPATVYASWNGATEVAGWRVLGGTSPAHLTPVADAPKSGFETAIALTHSKPYLAVEALNSAGAVLGNSHTIKP
jgi:Arylsulfotransferase (ASST)